MTQTASPAPQQSPRIWLITGVSSGFGQHLVEQALAAGDFVVGTVRKAEQLQAFQERYPDRAQAVLMDVNDHAQVAKAVQEIVQRHGRIDVLVNNAGYGLFGAIEEVSMAEARAQMETNFFGALAVTQAVLPIMRAQKSGRIVQISSMAGLRSGPGYGIYNASKHALEGFSEALALEVEPLGIKVILVEPGPFRTHWAGGSSQTAAVSIADYAPTAHARINQIQGYSGNQPGDPAKGAQLIVQVVGTANPPLRLPLGQIAIEQIRNKMAQVLADLKVYEAESIATAFDVAA
jgi:NAD(P)-dependent dehydrogenase (short-subunit alcohol dehydrogenase family)